jgi:hypothetical protein
MAHLFFIRRPIGTVDAIHPFEPPVRLRADLELHAAGCPSCTWGMRVLADSSLRAETITVVCEEGVRLADRIMAARERWETWRG